MVFRLLLPLGVTVMVARYVPAFNPRGFAETLIVLLFVPEVGLIVNHLALSLTVHDRPVRLVVKILIVLLAGRRLPRVAEKESLVGLIRMVGVLDFETVSRTGMVLFLEEAPGT